MWAYRRREDGKYEIYNKETGQTNGQVYNTPTEALKAIAAANKGGALTPTPVPTQTPVATQPTRPTASPAQEAGAPGAIGAAQDAMSRIGAAQGAPAAPPPAPAPFVSSLNFPAETVAMWYDAAAAAGFSGDALHRIVATVLAESGGNPNAHNTNGEDSRGGAQINVGPGANTKFAATNLFDPYQNMRAAWEISEGGTNFGPWSVWHETIRSNGKTINVGAPAAAIYETLWAEAAAREQPGQQIQPPSLPGADAAATGTTTTAQQGLPAASAPPPPPRIWDFFVDPKTNKAYVEILETGDVYELPPGSAEDSVEAIYTVLNGMPPDSPNRPIIEQEFELAKIDQGRDEFGRPYGVNGITDATYGDQVPLPEDLPDWMQEGLINQGDFLDQERLARKYGLDFSLYEDPRFARLPSGQLVVQMGANPSDFGGPVFANNQRIYRNLEEAEKAELAYGRAAAAEPTQRMRALGWDPEADYGFTTNDELLAALDAAEARPGRQPHKSSGFNRNIASQLGVTLGAQPLGPSFISQGQGVGSGGYLEPDRQQGQGGDMSNVVYKPFTTYGQDEGGYGSFARMLNQQPAVPPPAIPEMPAVPPMNERERLREEEVLERLREEEVLSQRRRSQLATIGAGY
jgi:hypothetical protein